MQHIQLQKCSVFFIWRFFEFPFLSVIHIIFLFFAELKKCWNAERGRLPLSTPSFQPKVVQGKPKSKEDGGAAPCQFYP